MRVLVTGANGFIGKNLQVHLRERKIDAVLFTRESSMDALPAILSEVDAVIHLAGVNRPKDNAEFAQGNAGLTERLCDAIRSVGRPLPVLYASSIQAEMDNPYGASKRAAEDALVALHQATGSPVCLYRLPNVFGKWCRPNYNSAVATFCHNIANGLPITVHDPAAKVRLVYVDDVVADILRRIESQLSGMVRAEVAPVYDTTVGELVELIRTFHGSRASLTTPAVGIGFIRALYATYMSVLRPEQFAYTIPVYSDPRGSFAEMLRTRDSGQFSYFTAHPGVTRGGHYHHTKNEKFLVVKGQARFGFRHILSGERFELVTRDSEPTVVETIPGWAHDITNIGPDEMVVLLWANEIFDRQLPDTIAHEV